MPSKLTSQERLELIITLSADSLSKARILSKITLTERPALRIAAEQIMKTVKDTHREIDTLNRAAHRNGKLDEVSMNRSLDKILKAARQINREVTNLLTKARQED